jgi:hypothetical protein
MSDDGLNIIHQPTAQKNNDEEHRNPVHEEDNTTADHSQGNNLVNSVLISQ